MEVPRRRRISITPQLTPGQASYVLERLISDRRVSPGDVNRYVGEISREIDTLEQRLNMLRDASGRTRRPGRPAQRAAGRPRRRRRRASVTPERRASQQLQGRYLGLIRQVPANRRGHYARVAKDKGREAAIKEMTAALGR